MRIRPTLKPGDICRLSKKVQGQVKRMFGRKAMVVHSVEGDSTDGRAIIRCVVTYKHKHTEVVRFRRRQLWFTGENNGNNHRAITFDTATKQPTIPQQMNNEGRQNCMGCGQPTTAIPGVFNVYTVCKNKGCSLYDR